MGSKIYVGGLPYSTTEQQLSDLFAVHGAVTSARIITDKFTGQSRGFGFVEMSGDSEAQAAINALEWNAIRWPHLDRERSPPAGAPFRWGRRRPWHGRGPALSCARFAISISGAAVRVAPVFFLPCCPLSGSQGHHIGCPCFPKIEI